MSTNGLKVWGNKHVAASLGTRKLKITVSVLLACLTLFQMLRMHVPDGAHEVAGVLFGVALAAHIVQHRSWFTARTKGKRSTVRTINSAVILGLLVCALLMVASGLAMSSWAVGAGLRGSGIARALHLPLVHIGFCLTALHTGLQIRRVIPNRRNTAEQGTTAKVLAAIAVTALTVFAVWSLVDLRFADYILGMAGFAYIDPSKPVIMSVVQYLAIFALFAGMGQEIDRLARRGNGERT